jgi:hypothetical protein
VNAFGHQTCDEAAGGLHHFASSRLEVGNVSGHGARRVFLTHRAEINPGRFPHHLFKVVEGKGAVAVDSAARGQIEVEDRQGRNVSCRAGSQKPLNGFALGGDQQVELHPLEVASFARGIAAIALLAIQLRAPNANVIAGREGETVDEVNRTGIELAEDRPQYLEQIAQWHVAFD